MQQRRSLFLLIIALALLVRVTNLNHFPPGLWFDEGLKGVDAWRTLHGDFRLIYPDVFPREPLFVWLLALVEGIAGPRVLPLRLFVTLLGALTCGLFFLLIGTAHRKRGMPFALAAAFILAASHWNAHFSRLLFRTNLVPLISILTIIALTWAARRSGSGKRQALGWIGAGCVAGVGFYTYLSWWFFLPVIGVWFWALQMEKRADLASQSLLPSAAEHPLSVPLAGLLFLFGAAFVFLPLGIHYMHYPDHLLGRPGEISPFRDGFSAGLRVIGRNALFVLEMFSCRGDHVPKHNVPWTPVLDVVWSVFFYAGIIGAVVEGGRYCWRTFGGRKTGNLKTNQANKKIGTPDYDYEHEDDAKGYPLSLAWLAWLFFMSLPSVFSRTDSANMLRNLGATPAVAYFVASGWWYAMEMSKRLRQPRSKWLRWVLVGLLIWGAGFQVYKLWVRHPRAEGIQGNFSVPHVAMAELCRQDPHGALIFVPTDIYQHKTFEFLTLGRKDILPLEPSRMLSRSVGQKADGSPVAHRVLCTMWSASEAIPGGNYGLLQERFPDGAVEREKITLGNRPFAFIFRIPASGLLPPEEAAREAERLKARGFMSDR